MYLYTVKLVENGIAWGREIFLFWTRFRFKENSLENRKFRPWGAIFFDSVEVYLRSTQDPIHFFQLSYKLHREESCDATHGGIIG